ncbi:MAG: 2,5-dichloro-2,5-cyclohexadiene-1,4-diol dehydrogenase [Alphaproteobacteria bacterium MarineAlpha5_Bin6]|nr:MAG: 2,5-dichloro-2,5-cyclohexadiene-1,4-diol dehydrogenase [Alphaproteobacteria bacterium MarineAlpha5_Bin6]|tara:strand:+ start:199 stop:1017 length:819 start_codon:yes stop_codon:yes gene_type:complete
MRKFSAKYNLKGKTSIVIGGLGLIGWSITESLIYSGSKVFIIDKDEKKWNIKKKQTKVKNKKIRFFKLDVSDLENLEKNFLSIVDNIKKFHILVNASYPFTDDYAYNTFADINFKSLRMNVDIHMNSYSWIARLSANYFKKNKLHGNILQLGSIYGIVAQNLNIYDGTDMKENMSYALAKGGITNLTRLMASYYGKYNIRINTIAPGGIKGHVANSAKKQNNIFVKNYSKQVPLKRLGEAIEVAEAATFLVSSASSYITGTTLIVDGGWSSI